MITRRRMLDRPVVVNPTVSGDPRTDRTVTWPDPATVEPEPGWLRFTGSQEVTTDTGTTVVSDWTLSLMPASAITAASRVYVRGERFEVVTRPQVVLKRGRPDFIVARLRAA